MLSDEHSCPVLTAALWKATFLPVRVCVYIYIYKYIYLCVFKFVCVHAPPLFRSTEAEGLTSALPETAAPHHVASDNTPAHHSVPYF